MRKIPFAGVELTSQRVRGLRGTSELPGRSAMCNVINTHTHTHTHTHKRKKCRKERVGSVAANSDNLGSNNEAGEGAQGARGSSKICTSRESVFPLSLIDPPLGGSTRVA